MTDATGPLSRANRQQKKREAELAMARVDFVAARANLKRALLLGVGQEDAEEAMRDYTEAAAWFVHEAQSSLWGHGNTHAGSPYIGPSHILREWL